MRSFIWLWLFFPLSLVAQDSVFVSTLDRTYANFRESSLQSRTHKHGDITRLLDGISQRNTFPVRTIGQSVSGRNIKAVRIGTGKTTVLMWSQMHGNEPTATQALFDLINWFEKDTTYSSLKAEIKKKASVYLVPMLNPDGAEYFNRRNAFGIDINRDAQSKVSPEAKILWRLRDSIHANFAFDLHDQNPYYGNPVSRKPATISFLAAFPDMERTNTLARQRAVRLISGLNRVGQMILPGQFTRYEDSFIPGAFDENFTQAGTSLVLIESGGHFEDTEKQHVRKMNFMLLASGLKSIAEKSYLKENSRLYYALPVNEQIGFDLLIHQATYQSGQNEYVVDIGVRRSEILYDNYRKFFNQYYIAEKGDLSNCFGYQEINAQGLMLAEGKTYPRELPDINTLMGLDLDSLIEDGYINFKLLEKISPKLSNQYPVNIVEETVPAEFPLALRSEPNFVLSRNGKVISVVINGIYRNVR